MNMLIRASLAGPVEDRPDIRRERTAGSGAVAVPAEERDDARFRSEPAAGRAEEARRYLPIGDDEMPA